MFKNGDRVKIVVKTSDDERTIEELFLQGQENKSGTIIGSYPGDRMSHIDEMSHIVEIDGEVPWHVPSKLLQKIPNPTDLEDEPEDTIQQIIQFTQNNKRFNVSFEGGKITLADWSSDPNVKFYRPKTIEELLELMEMFEKINEYKQDEIG